MGEDAARDLKPVVTGQSWPQQPPMRSLLVAHRSLSEQRRGRYVSGSAAHPDRMAPDLAATLIRDYSQPGDVVFDPLAGVGTTLIEAVHAGRDAFGVEHDPGWVALGRANLALARRSGASRRGRLLRGDATHLPSGVPGDLRGRVSLILTAAPASRTMPGHGKQLPPEARRRRVDVSDGVVAVLAGCLPLLRPDGLIVLVSRRNEHDVDLAEVPGRLVQRGVSDLKVVAHRYAIRGALRDRRVVPHSAGSRSSGMGTTGIRYDDILVLTATSCGGQGRHP